MGLRCVTVHCCLGQSAAPFNSPTSPDSPISPHLHLHLHLPSQFRNHLQYTSADLQILLGSKSRTTNLYGTPWLRGHVFASTSCARDIDSFTSKIVPGGKQGVSYWCGLPRIFPSHTSTGKSTLIGLVVLFVVIIRSIRGWAWREFRHRCCLAVAQSTFIPVKEKKKKKK